MFEDGRQKVEDERNKKDNQSYFGILLLLSIIMIFASSCQDIKKIEKPDNLIAKEVMVSILTDVYISNASRSINNKLLKEYNIKLDSLIYNKYKIDSLQFIESNAYYSSDLKTYAKIITSVEERLNLLKIEKDSIYEMVKKEKGDTIKSKEKEAPKLLTEPVESEIN